MTCCDLFGEGICFVTQVHLFNRYVASFLCSVFLSYSVNDIMLQMKCQLKHWVSTQILRFANKYCMYIIILICKSKPPSFPVDCSVSQFSSISTFILHFCRDNLLLIVFLLNGLLLLIAVLLQTLWWLIVTSPSSRIPYYYINSVHFFYVLEHGSHVEINMCSQQQS